MSSDQPGSAGERPNSALEGSRLELADPSRLAVDRRGDVRPVAVIETERRLKVARVPLETARVLERETFLGFDVHRRWRWTCLVCNLGSMHGFWTAAAAGDDAREHFADEHPRDDGGEDPRPQEV